MAVTAAVDMGVPGYLVWLTMRMTPFSVSGQVDQDGAPCTSNQ